MTLSQIGLWGNHLVVYSTDSGAGDLDSNTVDK